jgi:hypothetical protein
VRRHDCFENCHVLIFFSLQVDYQWKYRDDEHLERQGAANAREAATLQQAVYKDYDFNEVSRSMHWIASGQFGANLLLLWLLRQNLEI